MDEAAQTTPVALTELMELPDLGPKRIKQLYHELGIKSASELQEAARKTASPHSRGSAQNCKPKFSKRWGTVTSRDSVPAWTSRRTARTLWCSICPR